ncbi:MAG: indole-3-glycerol-phosphate synthase TrpC, partial [Lautropia mirabilis]|nr:indole-3-glycerol-phosphate synthase TrpC [Lautropia mirabilis]
MTTPKIPTILEKILQTKRTEITHARATIGEAALQRQAAERLAEDPPRGFA